MAGPRLADRCWETSTTTGTGTFDLAGAVTAARTLVAGIGDGNTCYYVLAHRTVDEWEVGIGTVTDAATDTLSRDKILASSNSNNAVNFSAGTKDVFVHAPASILEVVPSVCEGRITTQSGTPISTSDRTSQGTIYFTPYRGNRIALWNGNAWVIHTFSELSLALSISSGSNYDVFVYDNAGTLTLELSAAWTNGTTRADALTTQDGILVKSGATTRRYLGTIRGSGANVTEDSGGGVTTQVGGKRFVWNYYNQVPRPLRVHDTTDSGSYNTATFRSWLNSANNRVEWVVGAAETLVHLAFFAPIFVGSGKGVAGLGLGSTSSNSAQLFTEVYAENTSILATASAHYTGYPGLGYQYGQALERGDGAGTVIFLGDDGGDCQAGITGWVMG
jgi:hypothetical protein